MLYSLCAIQTLAQLLIIAWVNFFFLTGLPFLLYTPNAVAGRLLNLLQLFLSDLEILLTTSFTNLSDDQTAFIFTVEALVLQLNL
jgi:hypothetical protein